MATGKGWPLAAPASGCADCERPAPGLDWPVLPGPALARGAGIQPDTGAMRLLLCILPLLAATAAAETCKYVDKEGRVTYSNVPIKGARKVSCFQTPQAPAASPAASGEKAAAPGQPRVDNNTQRARDDERRRILESELAAEQEQLAQAQQALAEQE